MTVSFDIISLLYSMYSMYFKCMETTCEIFYIQGSNLLLTH